MKWAVIGLVALVVLGGVGYGVYRWTDAPEKAQEWMDEQDLKNFPTQARRELKEMQADLEKRKELKKDLQKDVIAREGRDTWDTDTLKQEKNGLATALWYGKVIERNETGIKDIVGQVKKERANLVAAGTVDTATGKVPADHEYTISSANGKTLKWTEARAKEETDKLAKEIETAKRKKELQERVITAKKNYVVKLDELTDKLGKKIEEMEAFISEMEVELELLKIEEDIAEINKSMNGEGSNKFGKAIANFRNKKKDFLAEQELADKAKPADDSYFSDSKTPAASTSASYWE
ncbi:MAG: hypothetical protein IPP14_00575 [Planctomycetes bacterium]|nr:hypothetical protein [Planctomycetota bacterium]